MSHVDVISSVIVLNVIRMSVVAPLSPGNSVYLTFKLFQFVSDKGSTQVRRNQWPTLLNVFTVVINSVM